MQSPVERFSQWVEDHRDRMWNVVSSISLAAFAVSVVIEMALRTTAWGHWLVGAAHVAIVASLGLLILGRLLFYPRGP